MKEFFNRHSKLKKILIHTIYWFCISFLIACLNNSSNIWSWLVTFNLAMLVGYVQGLNNE